MTKKLWFQVGIGILIALLIIKYVIEIHWIFNPIVIIIKTIFVPVLLSGVLFYISEPLQRWLEKKGLPRWASISAIVLALAGLVTGLLFIIGNPIADQVNRLVENAPTIGDKIMDVKDFILENKDNLPPQVENFIDSVTNSIQDIVVVGSKSIVNFVSGTVSTIFTLILVPFFYIFMLKDHEKFAPNIYKLFTGERRTWVKKTLEDINEVLKNYVQGQVLVSLILAAMIFIGYLIIGLEYSLLLAIFAFFMNMIPFIGPWISLAPAILVAFIQDPVLVIWVCVITLVAQQLESNLITPNIMGKTLDIHPLTVITIVLAAGNIGGFVAIIIGIPTYAVLKVIVKNIYEERKKIKETATKTV
ncbi:AI-2E family transporter [Ureibacillus sp. FSL K6-8385]|uniref:AI-2E family transporter n=1 Tax=Ureibacillus terrenus TaxID=118246 RepID=A0A540V0T6_9BACL|nr:AI-2E family transporter [Ureibacillus terrenus]MED3662223.1 AI-2E family transporter [Ureibacillus terrenus]MED3764083.1 AI-2E family transporter [Ureibacillus terrenus]TQE90382.1 AI-2E family transporter [Ureibacillus terrenus]